MNKIIISARVKSLAWRSVMMFVAAGVAGVASHLDLLNLTPIEVTFAGLVLGEISKIINDATSSTSS